MRGVRKGKWHRGVSGSKPIILLVNFAIFSGTSSTCVSSRHAVATGGVAVVAAAIPAAYGIMALADVPFVATIGTTPFLVLGVGVDAVFILVGGFSRQPKHEPVPDRVGHTLYHAGPAITLTALTDVLAFVVGGLTSPFRAILYFCLYTGTTLLLAFLFTLTAFVPLLALDGYREESGRSALTCCKVKTADVGKAGEGGKLPRLESRSTAAAAAGEDGEGGKGGSGGDGSGTGSAARSAPSAAASSVPAHSASASASRLTAESYQGRWLDLFCGIHVAPAVTSRLGVVLILTAWLGLLGASGWAVTQLGEGLQVGELAKDGHHLVRFDEWHTKFWSFGFPFNVVVDSAIDLKDGPTRDAVRRLPARVVELTSELESASPSFFDTLASTMQSMGGYAPNETVSEGAIDAVLSALLASPAAQEQFGEDVLWRRVPADGGPEEDIPLRNGFGLAKAALDRGDRVKVRSALLSVRSVPLANSTARAAAMVRTRETLDQALRELRPAGSTLHAFLQADFFVFFEADVVLFSSTFLSLFIGAAAIAAVTLVLLPHLGIVTILVLSVAAIDLILIGSMPAFGTKLNTISGINLLLSIGFAVDAVAHISHAFLHHEAPMRTARDMAPKAIMDAADAPVCCGRIGGSERRKRAVAALLTMGRPVLQGTGSSMLGLIALAASSSNIFRIFFRILFTTIALSLLHAIFVVPALLATLGPVVPKHEPDEHREDS